jgi:hypothetical protein
MLKRITRSFAEIATAAEQNCRGRAFSGVATAFRDACLGYMRWDSGIIPSKLHEISRKAQKTSDPEKLAKLREASQQVTYDFAADHASTQRRLSLDSITYLSILRGMWDSDPLGQ